MESGQGRSRLELLNLPGRPPYGVYVHIPFCRMLCTYCDFVKYRGLEAWYDRYVDAVLQEAAQWRDRLPNGQAVSLSLGGGTPSALGAARLRRLLAGLRGIFVQQARFAPEYSIEVNPEDISGEFVEGLRAAGFNRVSMGIQTFDDALLRRLGRLHSAVDAINAAQLLTQERSWSVNADFIFGLPGQTLSAWQDTLRQALELELDHVSLYALTLENDTPLGRRVQRGRVTVPNDDVAADMYDAARAALRQAGYRHYEVSNWARPGCESLHNHVYWEAREYVGLGAGAVGRTGSERWWNIRAVPRYVAALEAGERPIRDGEQLSARERLEELVMLGLRTARGLDLERYRAQAAQPLSLHSSPELTALHTAGMLTESGGRLVIPEQFWGVLHSITATVLAALPAEAQAALSRR